MNSISLSELTDRIQQIIKLNFDSTTWVRAEISELRENHNGHCYLELIEKDNNSSSLLAKVKAIIWSSTYRMLKPYFENTTNQNLRAGLQVLVAVSVEYSGQYGFSLNIRDIDPAFTIGETAIRRLQIIRQLEADGVAEMNKQLELPSLIQRIAIISSATAAGYDDFMHQLHQNPYGLIFYTHLFPAIMQGEQAEESIINALETIYEYANLFDAVILIRGGGAVTDLACFDSYNLALNCAQFPLPIFAGIGHQRDTSIVDMVAHSSLKTPTAVAEYLIQRLSITLRESNDTFNSIVKLLAQKTVFEKQKLNSYQWKLKQVLNSKLSLRTIELERQKSRIKSAVRKIIATQKNKISLLEKSIEVHSPSFMLKQGFTITTLNGVKVTSIKDLKTGNILKTYMHDGSIESTIN